MNQQDKSSALGVFEDYLETIEDAEHKKRMVKILSHIHENFPKLGLAVKWSQPMFLDHGTFIIALSYAKKHIALAPEHVALEKFSEEFDKAGYKKTKMLVQIPHNKELDFDLIDRLIAFNVEYKKDWDKFWLLPTR